jgi:hypothetical protein
MGTGGTRHVSFEARLRTFFWARILLVEKERKKKAAARPALK